MLEDISHVTGSNPASLSGYVGAAPVPSGTLLSLLAVLKGAARGTTVETRKAEKGARLLPGVALHCI